jgi:hypothetical protein
MSNVYPTVPPDLVSTLRDAGGIRTAIETGTFKGNGALVLAEIFDQAYSIELLPEIWQAVQDKYSDIDNLVFVNADSPVGLRDLGAYIHEPVVFWLDAHAGMLYTPTGSRERTPDDERTSGGAETQCPLLDEIHAIDECFSGAPESCVLVDDARAFVTPLLGRRDEDWPPLMDVLDALRAKNRRFVTILDDIIIAVPLSLRSAVENWRQKKLHARRGQEFFAYELSQLRYQIQRDK